MNEFENKAAFDEETTFDEVTFEEEPQVEADEPEVKEEAPQEPEADTEEYGKKVQKRINKEISKRKRLEAENKKLEERLSALERRTYEEEHKAKASEVDDQISQLKRRKRELWDSSDEDALDQIEEIDDQLLDLKLQKRMQTEQKEPQPQTQSESVTNDDVPEAQLEWLNKNQWYGQQPGKKAYTDEIYLAMLDEGYDPDEPETYQELDARLNGSKKVRDQAPAGLIPDRGSSTNGTRKKPVLTKTDLETMAQWGLDPNDPAARKEWLSNKGI